MGGGGHGLQQLHWDCWRIGFFSIYKAPSSVSPEDARAQEVHAPPTLPTPNMIPIKELIAFVYAPSTPKPQPPRL